MAIYLEKDELNDAYHEAQTAAREYFKPFDEFERLANNQVRLDIPKNYPKVNDGSLAALVLETAMRVIPGLIGGKFTVLDRDEPWLIELVNILWKRVIVPGAEAEADFYTKLWNLGYHAQTHGASVAFSYFEKSDRYTGANFSTPYIRDVLLEPGKRSDKASNYIWLNSYYTKLDLKKIIAGAEKEEEKAGAEKRDSFNSWDVKELKAYVDAGPIGKDSQDMTPDERKNAEAGKNFKLATAFHRGSQAPFFTVIPDMESNLARTRKNENPTGDIPINIFYAIQDLWGSPYGKGRVEISGATQNVLDLLTQADVLATQIGLEPPVKIGGANQTGLKKKSLVFGRRAIWQIGQAEVDIVTPNSSVYTQLTNRIGLYKGNLQNGLGASDATVSSESGNPSFSKTNAGVNFQEERRNTQDNFISRNVRSGLRQLAKNLMNIHMANMQGQKVFELMEDEIERLEKAGWPFPRDEAGRLSTSQARLEYDKLRGKFEFEPEEPGGNDPEVEALLDGIKLLTENPEAIQHIESSGKYRVDLGEAYRRYFSKRQFDKDDKIIVPITPDEQADAGNPDEPDSPEALQRELQQTMEQYGLDEEGAKAVMAARRKGHSEQEIATHLTEARAAAGGQQ